MKIKLRYKGGKGSGFEGHAGRPGEVGGSASGTGGSELSISYRENYLNLEPAKMKLHEYAAASLLSNKDVGKQKSRVEKAIMIQLEKMREYPTLDRKSAYGDSNPDVTYASRFSGIYSDAWMNIERGYRVTHSNWHHGDTI